MTEVVIQLSNVTFGYQKEKRLFDQLSCVLSNGGCGRIVALMGPSGVGKTTFCNLILDIHAPSMGTVSLTPSDARVAFIPQRAVIFDELSVADNIACLAHSRTLGRTFRKQKIADAAASLGLSDVLNESTRADSLSGGEAQRVMLARIQTVSCDVLVLDEPCSWLDNRVKESFLAGLRTVVDEQSLLAVLVTHVWDEARAVADDVLFFHQPHGRSTAVHLLDIDQAANQPPTLDAFFGVHWPDCAVVPLADFTKTFPAAATQIPCSAFYVALCHNDIGTRSSRGRAICPCGKMDEVFGRFASQIRTPPRKEGSADVEMSFYDKDGLFCSNEV